MMTPTRDKDRGSAAIIAVAALLGAAWAVFNLFGRADGVGDPAFVSALVWSVVATPAATLVGWFIARRDERWLAVFVCFCIYFFAIFVAARLELLVLGKDIAAQQAHALYFRLVIGLQLAAALLVALQRAVSRGTITSSTDA